MHIQFSSHPTHQAHHTIQNGEYFIKNKSTGLALDANTGAYQQHSPAHPRAFMYSHNPSAPNHKWVLERQSNGAFLLKTRYHSGREMALDGNTNVPQSGQHPAPFLYTATPHAPNHQWWLKPTGDGISYLIVNAANGLALDGNTSGNQQHSFQHASPFLYAETPHAPNHHWIIERVPAPALAEGKYLIVNKQTQQALDFNHGAAMQLSHAHPRVFTYAPTPSAPNHQWTVRNTGVPGEYFLTTDNGMALDGNANVPNVSPSHPMPFLYPLTPSAPNHKWRIQPVPHQFNTFFIVNVANNMALDGNVSGAPQHIHSHPSPFMWAKTDHAPNHHWEFRFAGSVAPSTNNTIGSLIGGLIDVSAQWIGQQQAPYPTQPIQPVVHHHHQPTPHHHPHHHQPHHQPHIHHQPHHPQSVIVSGGVTINENAFVGLLNSIKKGSFESDRTSIISSAAAYNHFSCNQLLRIIQVLSFAGERENACRLIIPKIVDKHNSHVVLSGLTFSSEKEKVSAMFR